MYANQDPMPKEKRALDEMGAYSVAQRPVPMEATKERRTPPAAAAGQQQRAGQTPLEFLFTDRKTDSLLTAFSLRGTSILLDIYSAHYGRNARECQSTAQGQAQLKFSLSCLKSTTSRIWSCSSVAGSAVTRGNLAAPPGHLSFARCARRANCAAKRTCETLVNYSSRPRPCASGTTSAGEACRLRVFSPVRHEGVGGTWELPSSELG